MRLLKLLLPLLVGLTAVSAVAGYKNGVPLDLNTTYKYAYGQVSTVRTSANTTERIGCSINSATESECYAINAQNVEARCKTTDPTLRKAIQMINSTSFIYFAWTSNGGANVCSRIVVENNSYNLR